MPIILGTAGHIDHGKTALIRALTGIDCDRLKDEKKRGITIELGFAYFDLPNNERIGIVDVPGHEKFVKNMVAGAAGIDFVLLTVAADEGIMPQTREHLEICSLLGIKEGLVALTKIDMVDQELLGLAKEDVQDFLVSTFLENAPIIPVSAHNNQGLDQLKKALEDKIAHLSLKSESDIFRLPIDRVFTLKGHGTVVTGTLISGQIGIGETVCIYPSEQKSKVRGLQVHGSSVEIAATGQRTAMNLSGLEVEDLQRGDCVARPETLFPWNTWDVELRYLASAPKPLKHRKEVHFHHGSKEVLTRIHLLDRDQINPGETALAQVFFPQPMVGVYDDNFVIRSFSPLRTIAGGRLINPFGEKIKKFSSQIKNLECLKNQDPTSIILTQLEIAGTSGINFAQLHVATNLSKKKLHNLLQDLNAKQKIFLFDKDEYRYVLSQVVNDLTNDLLEYIRTYHKKYPMQSGITRAMVTTSWGKDLPPKLVHFILERCQKQETLIAEQEILRLPEHKVSLAKDQVQLKERLLNAYIQAGTTPPNFRDILNSLNVSKEEAIPVLRLLFEEGKLVKVKNELYFSKQSLNQIKQLVLDYFARNSELTPSNFKQLTGLTRKYSIPLLEYLDKEKITIRVGDVRQLRKAK